MDQQIVATYDAAAARIAAIHRANATSRAPETSAPITLLELGLFAASGRLLVCCPPDYWRKGNVDVVCALRHPPAPDARRAVRRADRVE